MDKNLGCTIDKKSVNKHIKEGLINTRSSILENPNRPRKYVSFTRYEKVVDEAAAYKKQIDQMQERMKELENMAMVDSLTEVYSRRFFDERLPKEIERAIREKKPLSYIAIDVNRFKQINDTYGHSTGDEALRYIAKIIKSSCRNIDIPVRVGGDEFGIICIDADENGVKVPYQRLGENINKNTFKNNDLELKVTISVGCATLKPEENEINFSKEEMAKLIDKRKNDLVHKADMNMYDKKQIMHAADAR